MGRTYHVPVMAEELVELLRPLLPGLIVDATYGGGGHTRAIASAVAGTRIIGLDRDPDAVGSPPPPGVTILQGDFRHLDDLVAGATDELADAVVFDLGVSSHQLDVGERGFSFRNPGPLDMRMGPDAPYTADEIVNGWTRRQLAAVIRKFGEEPEAGRIADAIVRHRPVADTAELAHIVAAAVSARTRRRRHPPRRTFQALRIAVNDELGSLGLGLEAGLRVLRPGGRLIVISYHSLEDRIVKRRFAEGAVDCVCPPDLPVCGCGRVAELRLLTRKAIVPSEAEVVDNPRARSAKLRAVEKVAA